MSWKCRLVDPEPGQNPCEGTHQIGEMWFYKPWQESKQSADYKAHRQGKPMLWVQLPGGPFCLDGTYTDGAQWSWTGEPPNITVSPSINEEGTWHGWIRAGEIT